MSTFRNLLITAEQDAEIRAYIAEREANSEPWDTLRLDYMLKDMLKPELQGDVVEMLAHEGWSRVRTADGREFVITHETPGVNFHELQVGQARGLAIERECVREAWLLDET